MPGRAGDGFQAYVNGRRLARAAVPGSYFTINRRWCSGDTVEVRIPFRLRVEQALGNPGHSVEVDLGQI